MARLILADVSRAYAQALRETPDVCRDSPLLCLLDPRAGRMSYRQWLDRPRYNCFDERIPRAVIVRANLRRLGPIRLDPARLP